MEKRTLRKTKKKVFNLKKTFFFEWIHFRSYFSYLVKSLISTKIKKNSEQKENEIYTKNKKHKIINGNKKNLN